MREKFLCMLQEAAVKEVYYPVPLGALEVATQALQHSVSHSVQLIRSDGGELPANWGLCPLPLLSGREEVCGSIMPMSQETQNTKIKTLECLKKKRKKVKVDIFLQSWIFGDLDKP